jgi:hypothetical protein
MIGGVETSHSLFLKAVFQQTTWKKEYAIKPYVWKLGHETIGVIGVIILHLDSYVITKLLLVDFVYEKFFGYEEHRCRIF